MNTERKKKEKRVGIKYLKTKESTVLGLNPVQSYWRVSKASETLFSHVYGSSRNIYIIYTCVCF